MRHYVRTLATALVLVGGPCLFAAETFELGMVPTGDAVSGTEIRGEEGAVKTFQGEATLTSAGIADADGPQGWSIGVQSTGVAILAVTTDGTAVDDFFSGGFNVTSVIDPEEPENDGKEGFVSAVVLSFTENITLPPNTTQVVAIADYEATIPALADSPQSASLAFVNGLKGAGQPVSNDVTYLGATVTPTLGSADLDLIADEPPPEGGFQLAVGGGGLDPQGDEALEVNVGSDPTFEALLYVCPADPDNIPTVGPQGWSLSLAHDKDMLEADADALTIDGTDAGTEFSGGFQKSEVVDPADNEGQGGVVSAVVLSFTEDRSLDPNDCRSILKVGYSATAAAIDAVTPESPVDTVLDYTDALQGAGQPVDTVLTVEGETVEAALTTGRTVRLTEELVPDKAKFLRGDPNDDGKVNIADPIWIINELVRGGPATSCPKAADANDDGMVDLSDAMYLIEYRFLGGPMPSAPFADGCGEDPTDDELPCEPGSHTACAS